MPVPTLEEVTALNTELNALVTEKCTLCMFTNKRSDFEEWFRLAGRKVVLEEHLFGKMDRQAGQAIVLLANVAASQGLMSGAEANGFMQEGVAMSKAFLAGGGA